MRVGFDARLLAYSQGGISTYIRCLLRELLAVAEGETYVILRSRKDSQSFSLEGPDHQTVALWTPCHHRLEQLTLPLELLPLRLDLVHSPDFIPPFRRRCKSVITVHDLAFLKYPHLLTRESRSYYSQIELAVRSADAIIVVSKSTKNDLIELLDVPEEKITVIPEAPDSVFQPTDDRQLLYTVRRKFDLPEKFFLALGTVEPRKNLPTLIKAFGSFRRAGRGSDDITETKLVIAGPRGWLYDETFDTVKELRLTDSVIFIGQVSTNEAVALYNLATAFTMPSLYEGFGLPVLEAMACGAPVIASNTSSLPEVAGDAALLIDPFDVEAWAEAMRVIVYDADLRNQLRQRGLQRAREFLWRDAALQTRALYREVLGG